MRLGRAEAAAPGAPKRAHVDEIVARRANMVMMTSLSGGGAGGGAGGRVVAATALAAAAAVWSDLVYYHHLWQNSKPLDIFEDVFGIWIRMVKY